MATITNMTRRSAIEILRIEQGIADLHISNDDYSQNTVNFRDAVEVVLEALESEEHEKNKAIAALEYLSNRHGNCQYCLYWNKKTQSCGEEEFRLTCTPKKSRWSYNSEY